VYMSRVYCCSKPVYDGDSHKTRRGVCAAADSYVGREGVGTRRQVSRKRHADLVGSWVHGDQHPVDLCDTYER